jgi:N-acetyl-anhydromuramyl-L-alanine amidase AmpD|tara:strand:+ start:362 stop:943 length:582 start_codon:yes stop_codon:yes gene_type:complete
MKKELLHIEKESKTAHQKTQIMVGHTSRDVEDYLKSLTLRHNRKYKNQPHFIISKEGVVIKVLEPRVTTNFFGDKDIDDNIVLVLLENEGWLKPKKNNPRLCDWLGNIYKGEVFEKKWRNRFFWSTYTDKQIDSLVVLLKDICADLKIEKKFIGHNVRVEGVERFKGIVTRSNYSEYFTDLSPAFNFERIKEL